MISYKRINALLAMVKRFIYKTLLGCYPPKGIIKAELLQEINMGLKYRVYLPELGDVDVVYRELGLSVNGEVSILRVSADAPFVDLPVLPEGVVITITVRDTDDAGNVSWSEPYTFHTRDTIRPRRPGAVKIELLDEVADPVSPEPEPPTPDPDPEPEVSEDPVVE